MLKFFVKVFCISILSIGSFFVFLQKAQAIENRGAFVITNFDVGIFVKEDTTIEVEEIIDVNFSQKRHGIYRKIPVRYKDDNGFKYNMKLRDVSVTNRRGEHLDFKQYNEGSEVVLQIGDADVEIFGDVQYVISYTIQRGMRFFDDHDEIYWNPIGVGWPTKIYNASSTVYFEERINSLEENSLCFTGGFGSLKQDCTISAISSSEIEFNASGVLNEYEGLTIAVNLPKGLVEQPTKKDYFFMFLLDNWAFAIPILAFFGMFYLWHFRGKELDLGRAVVTQYSPPDNLTPGEVGYLIKERYSHKFVAADIVNLAVKGYLEIREIEIEGLQILKSLNNLSSKVIGRIRPIVIMVLMGIAVSFAVPLAAEGTSVFSIIFSIAFFGIFISILLGKNKKLFKNNTVGKMCDYELENKKDWTNTKELTLHEKRLLKGLFASKILGKVKLSDKKKFYTHVGIATKKIDEQIKTREYFEKSTINSKVLYVVSGVLAGFVMFVIGSITQRLDFFLSAIATATVLISFGLLMSKKTKKGIKSYWNAKGYEHYIDVAERYRAKFNEEENIFEKNLPFAMVFGNVDKWAKAFEGITKESPSWYHSRTPISSFRAVSFANSLNDGFASAANSASTSPSSSSSGGSSGGGGGGGGGGSW
ncbi:DUF2207 domain-containing protein [bacterium]|jgi:uncharacterized membrane protein YgcG|nr:DUF2207 domain-containing protein [bacterium]MBT4251182.1 DUF2207 domain-containing protein [bacterium]MBT4598026.1 DUF2207 domain-containing protein [bacterium]MBT6753562.1 DUF2207 domain-containing protein [bacterium]MBT7037677.1 DUF2207 domain-containing protein [bacterium]